MKRLRLFLLCALFAPVFFFSEAGAQTVFPAGLAGSYEADLVSALTVKGRAGLTVNARGVATGKLDMPNGKSYSFFARLAADGDSAFKDLHTVVKGPASTGPNLRITLRVHADGSLTGATQSLLPGIPAELEIANGGRLIAFSGQGTSVAPWQGPYTLAISGAQAGDASAPAGAGYATATISPKGQMVLKGKLGDGAKLSASLHPVGVGRYRLFLLPYPNGGYVSAVVGLEPGDGQYRLVDPAGAKTIWSKAAGERKAYTGGFHSASCLFFMEPWTKPAAGALAVAPLGIEADERFAVVFTGGIDSAANAATLPTQVNVTSKLEIAGNGGGDGAPYYEHAAAWKKIWNVKINPDTGSFAGFLTIKPAAKLVTIPVNGVLLLSPAASELPIGLGQYRVPASYTDGAGSVTGEIEFAAPVQTFESRNPITAGHYVFVIFHFLTPAERPAGLLADGREMHFDISDDLKILHFAEKSFALKEDHRPSSLVYRSDRSSVTIRLNSDTGEVISIEGVIKSGSRTADFYTRPPYSSNLAKF